MELTNEFRVTASIERAWDVFTNVELIAPCMPGAQLDAIEGSDHHSADYHGTVKVKVGPITAQYKGIASFQEIDEPNRKLVLRAQGRETRGQGNANATVTATMVADGTGTLVSVVTDLTVTGRVAQFGRGVLVDVSARLLDQFVSCLESGVLSGAPDSATEAATESAQSVESTESVASVIEAATSTGGGAPSSGGVPPLGERTATRPTANGEARRVIPPPEREVEPIDLLDMAGAPLAKRVVPAALAALAFLLFWRRSRRRKRRRAG